ncbi:MAG: hypothetical protein QM749_01980 [Aquabacterium sp.]
MRSACVAVGMARIRWVTSSSVLPSRSMSSPPQTVMPAMLEPCCTHVVVEQADDRPAAMLDARDQQLGRRARAQHDGALPGLAPCPARAR